MAKNGKKIDLAHYKYATGLMLMIAYACSIGGIFTQSVHLPTLL